jgi:hypothetical protein
VWGRIRIPTPPDITNPFRVYKYTSPVNGYKPGISIYVEMSYRHTMLIHSLRVWGINLDFKVGITQTVKYYRIVRYIFRGSGILCFGVLYLCMNFILRKNSMKYFRMFSYVMFSCCCVTIWFSEKMRNVSMSRYWNTDMWYTRFGNNHLRYGLSRFWLRGQLLCGQRW